MSDGAGSCEFSLVAWISAGLYAAIVSYEDVWLGNHQEGIALS